MSNKNKIKKTYYHHRLGPVSKLERKLEKTKFAHAVGTANEYVKNRIKKFATVSSGAAAIATLGAAAGLAAHFATGSNPMPQQQPTFHDPYFFHPDPIPLTSEGVEAMKHNKKRHHKSQHYHLGHFPPREDKRYRKNFVSKHLRGVTEDTENLDEFSVYNPLGNVNNAAGDVADRIKARFRNAESPEQKKRGRIGAAAGGAYKGIVGGTLGGGIVGGPLGAAAGALGGGIGGGVGGYLAKRRQQAQERQAAHQSVFHGIASGKSMYDESNEYNIEGDYMINEDVEYVGAAIDKIAAGVDHDGARELITGVLGQKILDNLELRKAEIAKTVFELPNETETE